MIQVQNSICHGRFGVFYEIQRPTYEEVMNEQIKMAKEKKPADLDKLLKGNETWNIV